MGDERLDIVFTAPHPDDLEIGMGGAIAKCVKLGYRVGMIHMTNGGGHPPEESKQTASTKDKPQPDGSKEPVKK